MNTNIVIVDTKCANLASLKYAIQRLGFKVTVTDQADQISKADKLFLPGVGSASAVMRNIQQLELAEVITNFTKPILGICLGMQILANYSYEGNVPLLNIMPEQVLRLPENGLPLPHMGWNQVTYEHDNILFNQIASGSYFYFIHSYYIPINQYTIANCDYGQQFSAAIQYNNFYAVQFHPERSGAVGSKLLQNFMELV